MTKKQFLAALLVLAVSGLAGGFISDWLRGGSAEATSAAPTIKAGEILLVDKAGKVVGGMGMFAKGPKIYLNNPEGKPVIDLFVNDGTPGVFLFDSKDVPRVGLSISHKESPIIQLMDKKGKRGIVMKVQERLPSLALKQKDGSENGIFLMVHQESREPMLSLGTTEENKEILLGIPRGNPHIVLAGEADHGKLLIRAQKQGGPSVLLLNKDEAESISMGVKPKLGPQLMLFHKHQKRRFAVKINDSIAGMEVTTNLSGGRKGLYMGMNGHWPYLSMGGPYNSRIVAIIPNNSEPKLKFEYKAKEIMSLPLKKSPPLQLAPQRPR